MDLNIISAVDGSTKGTVQIEEMVFGVEYNETLVHQLVVAYQAAGRAGTKAQKSRSDVAGGGAKPWRQKGTGRARAGTSRSPIWRKGGVTFAAKPRSYKQKLNKKMYRKGICCILSQLVKNDRLLAIEPVDVDAPKTKLLAEKIRALGIDGATLVTGSEVESLRLAARNLPTFSVVVVKDIDPVSLIKSKKIFMTEDAIRKIEEGFK